MPCLRSLLRAVAALALFPAVSHAQQGVLEVPGPDTNQSGIGVISGWHCLGQRIEISINGGAKMLAGSRTPRDDAAGICGRSDTGFSLLFNWSLLRETSSDGEIGSIRFHRVTAYADGVPFAENKVYVKKFGFFTEYMTGKSGAYTLRNFPDPGRNAQVTWDQDKQNFTITRTDGYWEPWYPELGGTGTYYGAVQADLCRAAPPPVRTAKFIVKTENGTMQLRMEYADGNVCDLPKVQVNSGAPRLEGFVTARFNRPDTASCADLADKIIEVNVNGKLLESTLISGCVTKLTGATFKQIP